MHESAGKDSSTSKDREVQTMLPAGDMDNPFHITGNALRSLKNVLRLSPRFQLYRKLIGVRTKTLIRILLTKWWTEKLEWYERIMLEVLIRSSRAILPEYFMLRELQNSNLNDQVEKFYYHEWRSPAWFSCLKVLLYTPQQFKAVMGLRRIKTFFQYAFVKGGPEQSGKPRLKKPRIRGYRDGKGKPMDQGLKYIVEANQFFYNLIERIFHDSVDRMILELQK